MSDFREPGAVMLRDMRESDIEDYVRWFTCSTEWMRWDAPWENDSLDEDQLKVWSEYYESVRDLPEDTFRRKFEIERDGAHIGWVSRYFDLEYMENPEMIPVIGIDIPETSCRNQGAGTEALRLFIRYLKENGFGSVYTQTWSGNTAMMRVAEKLGFVPVCRMRDYRTVNGKLYDAVTLKLEI